MTKETYTPGHSANAVNFMEQRTLASHGEFFIPYLKSEHQILDLGCGPGTISLGLAEVAVEGKVTGLDFGESQVEKAKQRALEAGAGNLDFMVGSCYELPFEEGSFDRVFSHALMEHLRDPLAALKEAHRVLKPGGLIGICSPDADGWLMSPPSDELMKTLYAYADMQSANGGDLRIGKRFGVLLKEAGFTDIRLSARYECYPSLDLIGEYLAVQFDQKGRHEHAETLREWSRNRDGMFAQAWVSAVGRKAETFGQGEG